MKLDSFVALIKDLRTNAISDDTDPSNILLQVYASPYDQVTLGESIRIRKNPSTFVWGNGATYTAYDTDGLPYQAPSCGWHWGSGGAFKKFPTSLSFDGVKDYVSVPHSAILKPSTAITIEALIKPTTIDHLTYVEIYRKEDGNDRHLLSFQNNGSILAFGIATGGTYNPLNVSINKANYENQWVHIAATYDGTTKRIYRNGVEIGNVSTTGTIGTGGTAPVLIGTYNTNGEFFKGLIDDVRIWNVARTQAQIQASKDVELTGTETGLVGYWKFNEGQGATAYDSTPNANNGTINGATWFIDASSSYTLTLQPVIYDR